MDNLKKILSLIESADVFNSLYEVSSIGGKLCMISYISVEIDDLETVYDVNFLFDNNKKPLTDRGLIGKTVHVKNSRAPIAGEGFVIHLPGYGKDIDGIFGKNKTVTGKLDMSILSRDVFSSIRKLESHGYVNVTSSGVGAAGWKKILKAKDIDATQNIRGDESGKLANAAYDYLDGKFRKMKGVFATDRKHTKFKFVLKK